MLSSKTEHTVLDFGIALTDHVLSLPIGVLHLGVKSETIRRAGYQTVGDLKKVPVSSIYSIPTVGSRTADQLQKNIEALLSSADDEGRVDWTQYCELLGLPLIPKREETLAGQKFLESLPNVFSEVADNLADDVFAEILRDRLCKSSSKQKTLEEIAANAEPTLTRERVRQKEKKLLQQLVGGLLDDNYGRLCLHFRQEFSHFWRIASESFSDADEISVDDFVHRLSVLWQVDVTSVMKQLPILIAIVTGEPQMPSDFRTASQVQPIWFADLDPVVTSLSVMKLRLGKNAVRLAEEGFKSLGDIAFGVRTGQLPTSGSTAYRTLSAELDILASCIVDKKSIDWTRYQQLSRLPVYPNSPTDSALAFIREISDNIGGLLELSPITKRCAEIFKMRTGRGAAQRMTLHQVAAELRTHQPTIKREETIFLQYLNDILINREFYSLPLWLSDDWLSYWSEAAVVYETSGDNYDQFADNLSWRWRVSEISVRVAAPAIWAVLSGYPNGRPKENVLEGPHLKPSAPLGRIRLKGFRKLH